LAQPGRVGELLLRQSGRFAVPAHERAHLPGTISNRAKPRRTTGLTTLTTRLVRRLLAENRKQAPRNLTRGSTSRSARQS
jgi:hypothetical protein